MVRSGDGASEDNCINETARNGTTCLNKDDCKRAGGSGMFWKTGVVVWDIKPDNDNWKNIKEQNSPEDIANNSR